VKTTQFEGFDEDDDGCMLFKKMKPSMYIESLGINDDAVSIRSVAKEKKRLAANVIR
jgi:hypothetical protein